MRVVVSSHLLDFGNTVRLREIEESEGKTRQQAQCWMMIGKIAQQTTQIYDKQSFPSSGINHVYCQTGYLPW